MFGSIVLAILVVVVFLTTTAVVVYLFVHAPTIDACDCNSPFLCGLRKEETAEEEDEGDDQSESDARSSGANRSDSGESRPVFWDGE